jgi:two-component system, LytTR family, sensor kinase
LKPIVKEKGFWVASIAVMLAIILIHYNILSYFGLLTFHSHVVSNLYGIALMSFAVLIANNLYYYRPRKMSYTFLLIWCVFFAIIATFLVDYVVGKIFATDSQLIHTLAIIQFFKLGFSFIILFSVTLTCLLWYTYADVHEENERRNQMLVLNKEAELSKLRQQLQPHFLFNSLNSINALVGTKPAEARRMIQQLSDFLRFTVRREDNQLISLAEELQHLNLYLEIEKVRFGNRLSSEFDCTPDSQNLKIPALLLQPVLENAIKFGLYDTTDAVNILLRSSVVNAELVVEIQNPYDPDTLSSSTGAGFGLKAIGKRLQLLYNRYDLLHTELNQNTFITKITIPQTQ